MTDNPNVPEGFRKIINEYGKYIKEQCHREMLSMKIHGSITHEQYESIVKRKGELNLRKS